MRIKQGDRVCIERCSSIVGHCDDVPAVVYVIECKRNRTCKYVFVCECKCVCGACVCGACACVCVCVCVCVQ